MLLVAFLSGGRVLTWHHPSLRPQCGRFQELSAFDGDHRSCRERLLRHAGRRRRQSALNSLSARNVARSSDDNSHGTPCTSNSGLSCGPGPGKAQRHARWPAESCSTLAHTGVGATVLDGVAHALGKPPLPHLGAASSTSPAPSHPRTRSTSTHQCTLPLPAHGLQREDPRAMGAPTDGPAPHPPQSRSLCPAGRCSAPAPRRTTTAGRPSPRKPC